MNIPLGCSDLTVAHNLFYPDSGKKFVSHQPKATKMSWMEILYSSLSTQSGALDLTIHHILSRSPCKSRPTSQSQCPLPKLQKIARFFHSDKSLRHLHLAGLRAWLLGKDRERQRLLFLHRHLVRWCWAWEHLTSLISSFQKGTV